MRNVLGREWTLINKMWKRLLLLLICVGVIFCIAGVLQKWFHHDSSSEALSDKEKQFKQLERLIKNSQASGKLKDVATITRRKTELEVSVELEKIDGIRRANVSIADVNGTLLLEKDSSAGIDAILDVLTANVKRLDKKNIIIVDKNLNIIYPSGTAPG